MFVLWVDVRLGWKELITFYSASESRSARGVACEKRIFRTKLPGGQENYLEIKVKHPLWLGRFRNGMPYLYSAKNMSLQDNATESPVARPRRYQWTLRTLMMLVLIFGLMVGWWVDHRRLTRRIPTRPQPSLEVRVFSIVNGDSKELAAAIGELFPGDNENPPKITAESRTNSVMVRGTAEDLNVIEAILLKLDQHDDYEARSVRKPTD